MSGDVMSVVLVQVNADQDVFVGQCAGRSRRQQVGPRRRASSLDGARKAAGRADGWVHHAPLIRANLILYLIWSIFVAFFNLLRPLNALF